MVSIEVPRRTAENSFNHYEQVGWTVGPHNRPMTDWKPAAQNVKTRFLDEGGQLIIQEETRDQEPEDWRPWMKEKYPPSDSSGTVKALNEGWHRVPGNIRREFFEHQAKQRKKS